MKNLDLECAQFGRDLVEVDSLEEEHLKRALSVLEEQGVYAFFLFIKARVKASTRSSEPLGEVICKKCQKFLEDMELLPKRADLYQALDELTDLQAILFARDLLRQALVYAVYYLRTKREMQ